MATYAIGDIHGCLDALEALLETVPILEDDLLVLLGDYVDRGPASAQVLDFVMELQRTSRCVALRGNHEVMMQDALAGRMDPQHWLQCGGTNTLMSYRSMTDRRNPELSDIPTQHVQFLENQLQPYFETATHIYVHASVFHRYELADQDEHTLYWERFEDLRPHRSGKTIICGHTAQKSGRPADHEFAICVDTWVYGEGWLTCLNVETGQYWQANQKRKTRMGQLDSRSSQK